MSPPVLMPSTPQEWQDAVDAAEGALTLDSARRYGLVTGGPKVRVKRCEEMLREGAARAIQPSADAVERFVGELLAAQSATPHGKLNSDGGGLGAHLALEPREDASGRRLPAALRSIPRSFP